MYSKMTALSLGFLFIGLTASAALFPKAVVKRFVFHGKQAQEIVALLGRDPASEFEIRLRLNKSNEWAVYLRDTPDADPGSYNIERPRYNTIHYKPTPEPEVTIEADWLDTRTGSSPRKPRYFFGSPFISDNSPLEGWREALKKNLVSPAAAKVLNAVLFESVIEGRDSNPDFKMTIYQVQDYSRDPKGEWGYQINLWAE